MRIIARLLTPSTRLLSARKAVKYVDEWEPNSYDSEDDFAPGAGDTFGEPKGKATKR